MQFNQTAAFSLNLSRAESAARRCKTRGKPQPHSNDAAATFYAQADKAASCYQHVLELENKRARRFDFVVRMLVDWLFEAGPALTSMRDPSLIYSRMRCWSTQQGQAILPSLFMSYNLYVRVNHGGTHGCPAGAKIVDDGFLVAPRRITM